jgi:hypothetical protein
MAVEVFRTADQALLRGARDSFHENGENEWME